MNAVPAGYQYEPLSGLWFPGEIPRYDNQLSPPGVAGRDRAGVMLIFQGDPIPCPDALSKLGYIAIVIAASSTAADYATSEPEKAPAIALDAMPARLARERAVQADERYRSFYNKYLCGNLPLWANGEFEALLSQLANGLRDLEADIDEGRNGRSDLPRRKCVRKIKLAHEIKLWPGDLTDQLWADKFGIELRTYQRAKHDYYRGFGGTIDS